MQDIHVFLEFAYLYQRFIQEVSRITRSLPSILKKSFIDSPTISKWMKNKVNENRFDSKYSKKKTYLLFLYYRNSPKRIIILSKLKKSLTFYQTYFSKNSSFTILTQNVISILKIIYQITQLVAFKVSWL